MSSYSIESMVGIIGNKALRNAKRIHDSTGARGVTEARRNQYGETSLLGDMYCESAALFVLQRSKLPIIVHSEEYGDRVLGSKETEFAAFLDGLDGSAVYQQAVSAAESFAHKTERGTGRYGTMLGIYKGDDPDYGDYLFGGVMEHSTNRRFYAVKGKGCWVVENGIRRIVRTSQSNILVPAQTKMHANLHFDRAFNSTIIQGLLDKLPGFDNHQSMNSTAVHVVDLASGLTDIMLEATRKGNLEFAAGYPLIAEAGGILMDINGKDLRNLKISEFGQDGYYPVIGLANSNLKTPFLDLVKED